MAVQSLHLVDKVGTETPLVAHVVDKVVTKNPRV